MHTCGNVFRLYLPARTQEAKMLRSTGSHPQKHASYLTEPFGCDWSVRVLCCSHTEVDGSCSTEWLWPSSVDLWCLCFADGDRPVFKLWCIKTVMKRLNGLKLAISCSLFVTIRRLAVRKQTQLHICCCTEMHIQSAAKTSQIMCP